MFFRCEAIVSLFQLMELATIQSTTDLKASWHSLDERPQKREFVTRRSYQGISSFFWKWIYHVFYHFSRLIHKVLWNPSHPDRCCPGKNREASGLFANDVTRYHIDRQRRKRGKRRGDKVCSFSHSLSPNPPSSLTCQCSPSSKACLEHIEVQVLSSPFQWCSIQFCDEVDCREYHESKYQGKRS